jgi:hypothetical protein
MSSLKDWRRSRATWFPGRVWSLTADARGIEASLTAAGPAGLALQTLLFRDDGVSRFLLMPGLLLMYMIGGRRQLAGLALAGMIFW